MASCEMHLWSASLQKQTSASLIIPEGVPGPWNVLFLLHGLSDNHTMWTRRTSVERYVGGLPLLVVMPDGGRGWYTDAVDLPTSRYESLITEDLLGFVDQTFPTRSEREGRAIAGLSMGGYGAFKIGLHRPDLFSAAVSHSGAVQFGSRQLDEGRMKEFGPILGPNPQGGPNDISALLPGLDSANLPALRFDCGVDDFLIESNRAFRAHLLDAHIPHEYAEHPGGHDWRFWDRHILDTLAFLGKRLGFEFDPAGHIPLT
jgi:putative tributyrin esterase